MSKLFTRISLLLLLLSSSFCSYASRFNVGGQQYTTVEVEPGHVDVYKNNSRWISVGPVSGQITDITKNWGWLFVTDEHSVYKASYYSNKDSWDMARRVWHTGANKVIDSVKVTSSGLDVVHTDDSVTTLSLADVGFANCNGTPLSTYYDDGPYGLIEYIPGTLPIIIGSPHGGSLEPDHIPANPHTLATDGGSQKATIMLADKLEQLTGKRPHVILNQVKRNRLDLNVARDKEFNQSNPYAMQAWNTYHSFVEYAKGWVSSACGKGLYIDMHTHGHSHAKNEVGMLLNRSDFGLPVSDLDALVNKTSLKNLVSTPGLLLSDAAIGPLSLGEQLRQRGAPAIPNSVDIPLTHSYFNGGYNTGRHGSKQGGVIDAIQIESHYSYINWGHNNRDTYIDKLHVAIVQFMEQWYGFKLRK